MKHIIVSPSGKLYGSEQVLLDYLKYSKGRFLIFVYGKDLLYSQLQLRFAQHRIYSFKYVNILYLRIFFLCLTGRVRSVYINEAGHSKYISALSKIFKGITFAIHVRIIEDARPERWPFKISPNVSIISVSNFLQKIVPVNNKFVYDPYIFTPDKSKCQKSSAQDGLRVAVIGRVSATKGIDRIIELLAAIKDEGYENIFHFRFYGDLMPDVTQTRRYHQLRQYSNLAVCGFELNKDNIYNSVDCVLHASGIEPLGRIFLEAIDYCKPFIGINDGGIGEIGRLLQLDTLLVDGDEKNLSNLFLGKLLFVRDNYERMAEEVMEKKKVARAIFSPTDYSLQIDSLLVR